MRLVFFGTSDFAVPSLRECAAHHDVVAVVTQPDRAGSRGRPAPRPVRDAAGELGLPVHAPGRIRDADAVATVLALQAECIVVASYGQILPETLLTTPPHGAVNVHASLLPRWRGASPVAHAILAGDSESGVSIMKMDAGLDTGPVYTAARQRVPDDTTTPSLTAMFAALGAELLINVLAALERGDATAQPQPETGVMLAPRLRRSDGELEWARCTAVEIDRHVRALQPWPGTTLPLGGVRVRVLEGAVCDATSPPELQPGDVARPEGDALVVAAREGTYRLDRVHPPGSRPMPPAAFLRGRRTAS